jgi:hypothetical protein
VTSITPAAAAVHLDATKEKARAEEEGRVQRVREQLLRERAEAAEQQQAFEEAKVTQMKALAAALQETEEAAADAPCAPQCELEPQQLPAMTAPPPPSPLPYLLPECPVCLACYQQPQSMHAPVSLPCGHSVCRQCVLDLQTAAPSQHGRGRGAAGGLAIACPSCCQQLELPPGGAQALPCNYGLVQMLELSAPRPLPPQREAAGTPSSSVLPGRISALERFWSEPVAGGGSSYVARVEALELIVIGAAQTGGALPARAAALEQHSGL